MTTLYRIFNPEHYDEILDFFGKPRPCEKCMVKPMCFSWLEKNSCIFIALNNPCEEADNWLDDFMNLDCDLYDLLRNKLGKNISVEDIIKIIDHWEENNEKLEDETGMTISSIETIGKYINELDPKYCHPRKSHGGVLILNKMINEALEILKEREK